MKKFFSVLAASLLLSALPAFSDGTGPYGVYGPSIDFGMIEGAQHVAFSGGTGPYGSYGPSTEWSGSQQMANKDECLLVAMNCPKEGLSTQEKIDRLNTEISKGTSVYTPDELNVLRQKLDDAYKEESGTHMNDAY